MSELDRPLLALTRRRAAPSGPSAETAAHKNMRQLIQLRWIAVGGQLVTILGVHLGLGVPLPLAPMLAVVAVLGLANFFGRRWLARHEGTDPRILWALLFDTAALSLQLYFSGGASNPFVSLFLLQVVLGAILLDFGSAWALVGVTALAYGLLTVLHRPLIYPPGLALAADDLYRLGAWISFVLIGVLLSLFITRISRNLRARDAYLAELRQHAIEEDAIVRMGLFASGAAHELGTPLASLSVILGDWRHLPKINKDPLLREELDDMEAAVQRCKTIVTDILDSAGEPRGEAMTSVGAADYIDELAEAWRVNQPKTGLQTRLGDARDAVMVAGPALRQAVWNLLDNAAEVSPQALALEAGVHDDSLVIAVSDRGPGFSAHQIDSVGKPVRSAKGAGHGMGLFLAANVARKLGGHLEVANREGGGARVSLVVPLTAPASPGARP
jgi:two-component system sensor histidine kinase RegB